MSKSRKRQKVLTGKRLLLLVIEIMRNERRSR